MRTYLPNQQCCSAVFELYGGSGEDSMTDYSLLYSFAMRQGIVAIVWDEVQRAMAEGRMSSVQQPSKAQKIQWAMAVEQVEFRYPCFTINIFCLSLSSSPCIISLGGSGRRIFVL